MRFSHILITVLLIITSYSCKKKPSYMNDSKLCEMLVEMTKRDQNFRLQITKNSTKKVQDSLMNLQAKEDFKNTSLLIEIIKSRGWPNKDSLGCKKFGPPMLILRHAPKEFFKEIKVLIDKEYEKGRLNGLTHAFIEDHLNGRPGMNFTITED